MVLYNRLCHGYAAIYKLSPAIELGKQLLALLRKCKRKKEEGDTALMLARLHYRRNEYKKAQEYLQKALTINTEIGDKDGQASCYETLGIVFRSVGKYAKAEDYFQKALTINTEIGDKHGQASCYLGLGNVFSSVGEYAKAQEYLHKALTINTEIGEKQGPASCYLSLGDMFSSVGEYAKAEDYFQKALTINTEIGGKHGQASCYLGLENVFSSVEEYAKAQEYLHKALTINTEIGEKHGEASCYISLGDMFSSVGEYAKAEDYFQKALTINTEIGGKHGQASCYLGLGNVFYPVGEYAKVQEYLHKALTIYTEIGDKNGQASCYLGLGKVFYSVGEYAKAQEYLHKALTICTEIGDKHGQALCYGNLGIVFRYVGEYAKAQEYRHKALTINTEIGDKHGQALCYISLGNMFYFVGEYVKAEDYFQKALTINTEIGDKDGQASCYLGLGIVFYSVGEYAKAQEYLHKALTICTEIGDKHGQALCYGNLGAVFLSVGECAKAEKYYREAIQISKDLGDIELQFISHLNLHYCSLALTGNAVEALSNLLASIERCERMLNFLGNNDRYKILFFDNHASPYRLFSSLCSSSGKHYEALHVVELGRARALADLVSDRYFVEKQVSLNLESFAGILKIIRENSNRTFLYISYHGENIFLWTAKQSKPIAFRSTKVCESYVSEHGKISVDDLFKNESLLRNFHVLPQEQSEDRSLFSSYANQLTNEANLEDSLSSLRPFLNEEEENTDPEPLTLFQVYDMLIAPVSDLLEGSEIIVVPDRCFFQVPFAALHDERNRFLSDTFRIRIVPSLTTLKLILDSPADSHSETGALIVGEPKVTDVYFKGESRYLCPLPGAKAEAEMIARLVPESHLLIGKQATRQAVLQRLPSVSLVHFAAHGDAERGEIALTPPPPLTPQYVLHMKQTTY